MSNFDYGMDAWMAMKETRYENIVQEVKEAIEDCTNISDAFQKMLQRVCAASHAQAATFWYYDRFYDNNIHAKAFHGGSNMSGVKVALGQGFVGLAVQKRESTIIYDCQSDSRFDKTNDKKSGFQTNTLICVPLLINGICFGCIQVVNKTDDAFFDDKDLKFVEKLASAISEGMFQKGLLKDFLANGEENKVEKKTADADFFKEVELVIRATNNYQLLSFDKQTEMWKAFKSIKKTLKADE